MNGAVLAECSSLTMTPRVRRGWLGFSRHELAFAVLVTMAVTFGSIHANLVYHMSGQTKDFGIFYDATRDFLAHRDMYASGHDLNPPHLHLLLVPLAVLQPAAAFAVWGVLSLGCLIASLWFILREAKIAPTRWHLAFCAVAVISSAATSAVIVNGQLSWILMLPVTLAWVAARRSRWAPAGALVGAALTVKPFLLIVLAYFILARRWRALAFATAAAAACLTVGVILFGVSPYLGWIRALRGVSWTYLPINASLMGFLTRTFTDTSSLEPPHFGALVVWTSLVRPLWIAGAGVLGLGTLAALRLDDAPASVDRSFALLLVASLLISPLGWVYYAWFPLGPAVAATSTWWKRRDLSRHLLCAVLGIAFCPVLATMLFQPHGWATATLGSVYFWGLSALWLALIIAPSGARHE